MREPPESRLARRSSVWPWPSDLRSRFAFKAANGSKRRLLGWRCAHPHLWRSAPSPQRQTFHWRLMIAAKLPTSKTRTDVSAIPGGKWVSGSPDATTRTRARSSPPSQDRPGTLRFPRRCRSRPLSLRARRLVSGTRFTSRTSTSTTQPSSLRRIPVVPSAGHPTSSATVSIAPRAN